jgi:hypothetical protein
MDDKNLRQTNNQCTLGAQTGPQTIIVRQIIGEVEKQKVLDIHVVVPDKKPAIEQIVDVFVKEVEINSVDIITDKVIVRGEFEIKAIYVAALPDQPVHAVEIKHYKWTQDVDLPGARKGMDADASVVVEFVDYDVADYTRAYKYKNFEVCCDDEEEAENVESETETTDNECEKNGHHHHHHVCREFDVSVVLKIIAKVMTDREVQIGTVATTTGAKG